MSKKRMLYKTTIVIWSEEPSATREIVALAQEATDGTDYCSKQEHVEVPWEKRKDDPDWDDTEFFGCDDDE